jgi:RNA polymerase sigma factor (sigma-70 family)
MIAVSASLIKDEDYAQIVTSLLPEIRNAVSVACMSHRHNARRDEIEDLCQQTLLMLIQADYRCLRSFDERKSSLKTWLKVIVKNHTQQYLLRQNRLRQAEEVWLECYNDQSYKETQAAFEYRRHILQAVHHKLTAKEKQFYEFLCTDDLPDTAIAELMRINPASVRRRRYALIRKIQRLIKIAL